MKSGGRITIVLADDHPIVRQGLAALVCTQSDLQIVGEVGDGIAAVDLAEKIRPDILVTDIQMPGILGLEVVRQMRLRAPQTRTIIFSMYATDAYVIEAFRAGAWGYLLKGADATELIQAIRAVRVGKRYLCNAIPGRLRDSQDDFSEDAGNALQGNSVATTNDFTDPYDTLTTREREVLQLVAEGMSNKDAGERLFISFRTVEIHRSNALRKLGLRTHNELVRYALSKGLLPPT